MDKKIVIIIVSMIAVIGLVSLLDMNYMHNNITGQEVASSVTIIPAVPQPCNFTIQSGWNMVSFFCLGMWVPKDTVLSSVNDSYTKIFSYSATDVNDPWKSYNPTLPTWAIQQVEYMDRLHGYWIYMASEDNYYYNGSARSSLITLYPGWNLVGYPSINTQNINDSLNGVMFNIIKTYDRNTNTYLIYVVNGSSNTLTTTDVYHAYWINSTASQSWSVG